MSGLRERKKKQNLSNIIKAAKTIFSEKGYQQTSMTEIAKSAQVGTGTIYNYFPSKSALLLTIFSEELAELQKDKEVIEAEPSKGFVTTMNELLEEFTVFFKHYTKSFWREIIHVSTEEVEESVQFRSGLFGLDEEAMLWVKQIIVQHKDCFRIPIQADEAANAIYGVMMMQTMQYIYDEKMTYEYFVEQLKNQVHFIFVGKIKE